MTFLVPVVFSQQNASLNNIRNLTGSQTITKLDTITPLDKHIFRISNYIEKLSGVNLSIYKVNKGPVFSDPVSGIIINENELSAAAANTRIPIFLLADLLVAHEASHMLQFKKLDLRKVNKEYKKILECQADILAGYYYSQIPDNIGRYSEKQLHETTMALFYYTSTAYNKNSYPGYLQRVNAVDQGYLMAETIRKLANQESIRPERHFSGDDVLLFRKDPLEWSWKAALEISGFCKENSRYILRESVDTIDSANGYVYYRLTYKNISRKEITMSFPVRLVEGDYLVAQKRYCLVLAPGKSYQVLDSLPKYSAQTTHLLYPPSAFTPGSFLSEDYQSPDQYKEFELSDITDHHHKFSYSFLFAMSLDDIINVVKNQSTDLTYGPGIRDEEYIQYQSSYYFPNSVSCFFVYSNKKLAFRSRLASNEDEETAKEIFSTTKKNILLSLDKLRYQYSVSETAERIQLSLKNIPVKIDLIFKELTPRFSQTQQGNTTITTIRPVIADVKISISKTDP